MASLCSRFVAFALALGLCLAPRSGACLAPEAAKPLLEDAEAQANLDAGLERFYAEDFEGAARFFAQAYAIEPTGFLLYSWAQAERYNNRCARAIELFERFLATDPPSEESEKAREKIVECGGVPPAPKASAAPAPAPVVAPPASRSDISRPPPPSPRGVRFAPMLGVGLSLTTVGLGVGATGAILAATGVRIRNNAPAAADQQSFLDERTRGETRTRTGWALVGTAGGLVAAGVVLLVVRAVKVRRLRTTRGG